MTKLKKEIDRICGPVVNNTRTGETTMTDLANDIGVSASALCRYANGTRQPGLIDRLKINRYFGKMVLPIDKEAEDLCLSIRGLVGKEE